MSGQWIIFTPHGFRLGTEAEARHAARDDDAFEDAAAWVDSHRKEHGLLGGRPEREWTLRQVNTVRDLLPELEGLSSRTIPARVRMRLRATGSMTALEASASRLRADDIERLIEAAKKS